MWIADKLIYRSEDDFIRAYQGSELVWERPTNSYYISWTPSDLSGTFSMFGQTYNLEDYSGYFSWMGDNNSAKITSSAFQGISLQTIETNVEIIENNAFANCTSLLRISASNILYISNSAFRSCSLLRRIDFPVCSYIGRYTFANCTSLSQANLPEVLYIDNSAFATGKSLSILLPKCSVIGQYAFYTIGMPTGVTRQLYISCPVCESYGNYCFHSVNLISADQMDFTSCRYIGMGAFQDAISNNRSYPVYEFPNCSYIGDYAFKDCGFKYIKLSNVQYIGDWAFEYTVDNWEPGYELLGRVISIYTDSVCSLGGSYAFAAFRLSTRTFFWGAQTVKVPYSLLSSYKSANVWSDHSNIIVSIPT